MPSINIAEAKAKLAELLDRATPREDIVIARAGRPVPRLVPVMPRAPRKRGAWRNWKAPTDVVPELMAVGDLALVAAIPSVPGFAALLHKQPEYGERGRGIDPPRAKDHLCQQPDDGNG